MILRNVRKKANKEKEERNPRLIKITVSRMRGGMVFLFLYTQSPYISVCSENIIAPTTS
jgi:hypothetical protein